MINWMEISRGLEEHHAVFYQCWEMGKPVFTTDIQTACVRFNKQGDYIEFRFNPDFWESLSEYDRKFVICHECLHIILNHGYRTIDCKNPKALNVALDVVVNHMLLNSFGFKRENLSIFGKPNGEDLCWIDTIFKEKVEENQNFEYYYNLIPNDNNSTPLEDMHSSDSNFDKITDKLSDCLSNEDKQSLSSAIGGSPGEKSGKFIYLKNVKKSKKWETIVQDCIKRYIKPKEKRIEQWTHPNRRFSYINNLFLPNERPEDDKIVDKIPIIMFLDTSGSCYKYKERFVKLALSIPKDKFLLKVFCFDTWAEEINMRENEKINVYGGGGTNFHILEDKVLEEKIYPEAVFVITDGYGSMVYPQIPQNWHWLLLPYNSTYHIPSESHIYKLADFE